jgi:hypothetical protein
LNLKNGCNLGTHAGISVTDLNVTPKTGKANDLYYNEKSTHETNITKRHIIQVTIARQTFGGSETAKLGESFVFCLKVSLKGSPANGSAVPANGSLVSELAKGSPKSNHMTRFKRVFILTWQKNKCKRLC